MNKIKIALMALSLFAFFIISDYLSKTIIDYNKVKLFINMSNLLFVFFVVFLINAKYGQLIIPKRSKSKSEIIKISVLYNKVANNILFGLIFSVLTAISGHALNTNSPNEFLSMIGFISIQIVGANVGLILRRESQINKLICDILKNDT